MRQILIIRFGALGDLCLLAWSLSRWARGAGAQNRRVTLVTKAAFAPLMEKMHGIDRVISLPQGGIDQLATVANLLRGEDFDVVIDGHNILRSHLLLLLMGRRPATRLKKDTAARLSLLGFGKKHRSLEQTMVDRFDALFTPVAPLGPPESPGPLFHLREGTHRLLGIAPGAQWDSKRWPQESYSALLRNFRQKDESPVRIFLGPRENLWFQECDLSRTAENLPHVEIIRGRSLLEVAALLAECSVLLTNDSGLLHMAEAVETPVLAFYGPTVGQFGYFPRLPGSRVMEVELDCRPCSRNGKKACHRGDLFCLQSITPEQVLESLEPMLSKAGSSS